MILLTFIILCYGICNIIIYSSLFTGFRDFLKKFGTVIIVYINYLHVLYV